MSFLERSAGEPRDGRCARPQDGRCGKPQDGRCGKPQDGRRGKPRAWLARGVLLALSALLALAVAEAILGGLRPRGAPRRDPGPQPAVAGHDPLLGWSLVPNARGRHRTAEYDVLVRVNSQGFRADRTYSLAPPPGVRRIVVVGDSFTFGQGVEVAEAFASRLERLLPATEVVNLGVAGYGTDQQLLMLKRRGLAFRPDVVLLGLLVTNVLRNDDAVHGGYGKPLFRLGPDGRLTLANVPVPERATPPRPGPLGRSRLVRFMRDRLEYGGHGEAWPVTAAILREMAAASRRAGARLVVLVIPTADAVQGSALDRRRQAALLSRVAALVPAGPAGEAEVVDPTPALIARYRERPREPLYYEKDGHLTAAGHAAMADELARLLRTLAGPRSTSRPSRAPAGSTLVL